MKRSRNVAVVVLLVLGIIVLVGCNSTAGAPGLTPQASSAPTAAPDPTAEATPTPRPLPTPSAEQPIVVAEPRPDQAVQSPLRVAGQARVFEANVRIEVVDAQGKVVYSGFTTATAGAPEIGSFDTEVSFDPPSQAGRGFVRVFATSPRDGSRVGLVEIPVNLSASGSAGQSAPLQIQVYFTKAAGNDVNVVPVSRTVPHTLAVGKAAISELLKGPTEEEKESGLTTVIPTGAQLNSLKIENGTAYADFNAALGAQVSGSLAVATIRRQITQTMQQFSTVQQVAISIDGKSEDILQP
ncbi:MAG: GerMN domain-containing protein [Dehalococcoidales bacterium]|nr:GerMN domain-containing protein [Dehalococcoidales bacterium]